MLAKLWKNRQHHIHFWGDCLVIKGFSENVKREIKGTILKVYVPLEPVLFLLGATHKEQYNLDEQYILINILLISRK